MASDDFIDLRSSSSFVIESEQTETKGDFTLQSSSELAIESAQNEVNISINNPSGENSEGHSSPLKEVNVNGDRTVEGIEEGEIEDTQLVQTMELDNDAHETINSVDNINEVEKINGLGSLANSGNACTVVQNDHSTIRNHGGVESSISGVKRARMTYVDQEPSVHVVYKSLTSASKRKLEGLLQQWSQWHAQQDSTNDPNETLESGEQTLFPALHYGLDKASTVSFWMDNQTNKEEYEFIPLDGDAVPMYDRGFTLGLTADDGSTNLDGGLDRLEASRCFNCGSYSHALKDCQRPRDNAAVDIARKQHKSKRNQTAGSRTSSRYYEDTPGGKYDGIRPGVLSSETRELFGIGELDPPPWLQRMREIGYPPGYLDPDYEDQPSGITMYADDEKHEPGEEDGEILDTINSEPKKKMTVDFPGINAPIPKNADDRIWASRRSDPLPIPRRWSDRMEGNYSDTRRSRDYRDDSPRHRDYIQNHASDSYSPRENHTPNLGRSLSDRGRWSPPPAHDDSLSNSPYDSPYSESRSYSNRYKADSSSQRNDRHDNHRHRRT